MLEELKLHRSMKLKAMSKGMKEKLQLILVMSRDADLYCLDEPIGGVDPASREYILNTIITNYNEHASVIISTHLIADVEMVLDDAIFLNEGKVLLHASVDEIRSKENKSIDAYFRRCSDAYQINKIRVKCNGKILDAALYSIGLFDLFHKVYANNIIE